MGEGMDPHPSPGSSLHLVSWLFMDVVGCIRLHSLGNVTGMACGALAPAEPSAQQTHTKPGDRTGPGIRPAAWSWKIYWVGTRTTL